MLLQHEDSSPRGLSVHSVGVVLESLEKGSGVGSTYVRKLPTNTETACPVAYLSPIYDP